MLKQMSSLLFSFSLVLMAPSVSWSFISGGGTGGAAGAQMGRMQSLIGAAGSGAYAAQNFSCCGGPGSFSCCIKGVMGIMQLIQMLQGAKNSGIAAEALINGAYDEFAFDPYTAGFCTDSTSCSPDAIDSSLSGFTEAFKTGTGYDSAIAAMEAKALDQLADIEKKGFKVDKVAGTITDPSGKTTKFSDVKTDIPKSLSKSMDDKLAGVQTAMNAKTSGASRGVASKGGVIFKDEFVGGGLKGAFNKKNKVKKKDASEFLAGLSDKDAAKGGVGFAGDNIFNMIKRRYSKKMKDKEFLGK